MAGSPCGLATDCNPLKRMEMALRYCSLLQHTHTLTQSGTSTCVLTHCTHTHRHTNFSHHWLLRREIAIGVRQGFNWSWSQFNVRQGLAVIGWSEEGRVRGGDITVPDVKTRRPWWQEFCDVTHKDVRVLLGKCEWKSGQWRDGRHQAELNPNFPVTFWARSWLFLALCRTRDRADARVWPVLFKSTTGY